MMENEFSDKKISSTKRCGTLLQRDNLIYCEKDDYSATYTEIEIRKLIRKYFPHIFSQHSEHEDINA